MQRRDAARAAWAGRVRRGKPMLRRRGPECSVHIRHRSGFRRTETNTWSSKGAYGRRCWRYRSSPARARLVQGHETALAELRPLNHQAVWGDVVIAQTDRFGDAQPSAREQRKQRAVGRSRRACGTSTATAAVISRWISSGSGCTGWAVGPSRVPKTAAAAHGVRLLHGDIGRIESRSRAGGRAATPIGLTAPTRSRYGAQM